ncbi:hypothetical protein [Rubrobacter marinus]|uniref:hypothetical protein n=1 Tax=Rubrobacter marinus TaxID=2653852 RepID=UPI001407CFBB|nr:hypothetical protein [Rubrobacter marinus]
MPGKQFVVSDSGGDKTSPSLSGGLVVWDDKRNGNSDIYGKRLLPAGQTEFPVTAHPGNQRRPAVSGDFVVWEDDRNGDWDVYGKDLSLGPGAPEVPIVVARGDQRKPKISGKKLVWEDGRRSTANAYDLDVYYKDLATDPPDSQGREVSAPAGNQTNPAISGDTVVWEDDRNGRKTIYGKDLASAEAEFSVGAASAWQDMPAISGSLVVWRQEGANNHDIFGRDLMAEDLETGRVFQVTTNASDQWAPAVSGTVVVWSDGRNGDSDTYGKDVATGREFAVATGAGPQETPAVDGETVVWEDQRAGDANYGTWDIHGSNLDAAPAAPNGLSATAAANGVNLTWSPNITDADLAGYNVYRADAKNGTYTRLNAALLPASTASYLEKTALPVPGATYRYQVRAQDAAGNESAPAATSVSTPPTPAPPQTEPPTKPPVIPPAQPPAQPPVATPRPAPAPPQVVINTPKPVVSVGKIVRITVRGPASAARLTLTISRNGKVISRKVLPPNSRFAFKPTSAGKYTVKAGAGDAGRSKTFRAR